MEIQIEFDKKFDLVGQFCVKTREPKGNITHDIKMSAQYNDLQR
jgi:hypothetical protein